MDGLRAIAASSVLAFHVAQYGLTGGDTGVRFVDQHIRHLAAGVLLFFTLSGLLLYAPFAAAIAGDRPFPKVWTFARNRVLRIVPAYWVALLAAGVVFGVAAVPGAATVGVTGSLLDHPRALLDNLLLVQGYRPSTVLTGIGPAWTLSVELAFYATLPVISAGAFALAVRGGDRRVMVFAPPAALLIVGFVGKLVAANALDGAPGWERTWASVIARSFLANADLFAAGMTVAAVAALVDAGRLRLPRWWPIAAIAGAIVTTVAALRVPGGHLSVFRYDSFGALASALAVSVLVIGNGRRARRAVRVLEARALVVIGVVSYSLYLWHQPVIDWLLDRGVLPLSGLGGLVAAVVIVAAITGVLSAATYVMVERPALRKKRPVTDATADAVELPSSVGTESGGLRTRRAPTSAG